MSTRDELEKAAEWFEELSSYHSNPTLMAKEKLAATALREKASAVEGFEAWVAQKQKEQATPLYNYDLTICREAYAAGHAAASERAAELERERTLLVTEVRRCWKNEETEFYDDRINMRDSPDAAEDKVKQLVNCRPAEVRAIVEAQP